MKTLVRDDGVRVTGAMCTYGRYDLYWQATETDLHKGAEIRMNCEGEVYLIINPSDNPGFWLNGVKIKDNMK